MARQICHVGLPVLAEPRECFVRYRKWCLGESGMESCWHWHHTHAHSTTMTSVGSGPLLPDVHCMYAEGMGVHESHHRWGGVGTGGVGWRRTCLKWNGKGADSAEWKRRQQTVDQCNPSRERVSFMHASGVAIFLLLSIAGVPKWVHASKRMHPCILLPEGSASSIGHFVPILAVPHDCPNLPLHPQGCQHCHG